MRAAEENAEAVFQLRAAVVSRRWEEILEHTRAAMASDRRTDWRWMPLDAGMLGGVESARRRG